MTTLSLSDAAGTAVSRETEARLRRYEALIGQWTQRINLISKSTQPEIWHRHILDSAQLFAHLPTPATHAVDLGSGGGLPGLVLAALAHDLRPDLRFTLIESDQRKATFLRAAARDMGLTVTVLTSRIEAAPPQQADIVTSRALAPLDKLIPLATRHLAIGGQMLFLKGANWQDEMQSATTPATVRAIPSLTAPGAVILVLNHPPR